ncbi:tyrosinase 2 [Colletotrichum truncatum]|uniref:Tyrosinase 2 n=1 Tax=Colletotrichum truncatum TaxID=5467 RepID=A0ACC3YT05_COLTU|nr:tyrosinase 2 [Colletotrichum truncatum]KAF6798984.1 tyrosinase 2 [Colletotrichum truncatum]
MAVLPVMLILGILLVVPRTTAEQDLPIVGVRSGVNQQTGEVPVRRDINVLYEEGGPQWDLYVGALTAMQDANETDPTSYFQIAGIHGQPYIAWSGGGPQTGAEAGYCPHNQMQFGTWHRGYLSLHEQILVHHAKRIASTYPKAFRRRYIEAAEILRLAYWDWAAESNVPPVTALSKVVIKKPVNGTLRRVTVHNPFFSYEYPKSAVRGDFGSFDGKTHTKRCADQGQSYPHTANNILGGYNLKEKVYNVFMQAKSFDEMVSSQTAGANFEGPHGEVHVGAACGQDLAFLATSAFDYLFWLHHTNVDRLIAYWQALHFENATMHFSYPSDQMFATPPGTVVTPQSPLWPFVRSGGQALTSESVTHIRDWGYTYSPIRFWDEAPGETKMAVSRTVNELYGPPEIVSFKTTKKRRTILKKEYFARVEVERGELELPCQVQLFFRNQLAGSFTLLDMPRQGKSYDEIPLTTGIKAAGITEYAAKTVLEQLQDELEVVIRKLNGAMIALDRVPGLKIEVEDVEVIPPSSLNELPTVGITHIRMAMIRPLALRD